MIKLDPTTHDLTLDAAGRYVALDEASPEGAMQSIKVRLLHVRGEWFADTRQGLPWFSEILAKGTSTARICELVRRAIASVPTVLDVPSVEIDVDRATRTGRLRFTAALRSGAVIRSEDFAPVILD